MTQISITTGEHTVTVNHDGGDLSYIVAQARRLWEETHTTPGGLGPATGFTTQISQQWNHDRPRPVRAEQGAQADDSDHQWDPPPG